MYVRIDSMNIWKTRKLQYQNIWTNDLEDGMTTLVMTLDLSEEISTGIRRELSKNQSGWMAKEVMNLIYERTGVKYHEVHIYRLLHKWGFSPKVPRMRFVNARIKGRQRQISKKAKRIISHIPKGFTVAVAADESIFTHDSLIRRKMWTVDRIRPIVTMTGSHQRTCVFGALCIDGRQFFRQYDSFNQYTFLDYIKRMQKRFGRLILFIDRARQHHRSKMVRKYIKDRRDVLKVIYFPKKRFV